MYFYVTCIIIIAGQNWCYRITAIIAFTASTLPFLHLMDFCPKKKFLHNLLFHLPKSIQPLLKNLGIWEFDMYFVLNESFLLLPNSSVQFSCNIRYVRRCAKQANYINIGSRSYFHFFSLVALLTLSKFNPYLQHSLCWLMVSWWCWWNSVQCTLKQSSNDGFVITWWCWWNSTQWCSYQYSSALFLTRF